MSTAEAQGLPSALRALAVDALTKGIGGTLTTNSLLQERLGLGAGTIQRALDALAERDALHTISRGHLGRRIDSIQIGQVWQVAALPPVRLTLSPAGAVEMDVLEEALTLGLAELGVPGTVHHLPGGSERVAALERGEQDLTVISTGTLSGIEARLGERWPGPIRLLERGSYYAPDRLVVVTRTQAGTQRPQLVAIDRDSYDHTALTRAEFPEDLGFQHVEVPFPDVPGYVLAGIVDAGVWHVTRSPVPPTLAGLALHPVRREQHLRDGVSRAAMLAGPHRPEVRGVLKGLGLDGLIDRQRVGLAQEAARARLLLAEAARRSSPRGS